LTVSDEMRGAEITSAKTMEVDGWNATNLNLYSHAGTHMDAPRHFLPGGSTIDEHNLEMLVGPALVVDLSLAQPNQLIGIDDFASIADQIKPGSRLLIRTDWSKRYGTTQYRDELPRISLELAE